MTPGDVSAPKRRLSKAAKEFTPKTAPTKPKEKKPYINVKQLEKLYMQNLGFISAVMTEENKHVFKNQFLRLEEYSNLESVRRCFDPLEFVNESSLRTEELQQSKAVVIRSKTYDDIHKAMKYGVWTSSRDKNERLNQLYKECLANKQRLLLFFRVVKDNLFCGVAEVISHHIEEQKFNLWWENQKWQGIFNIRWIYVKNLPLLGYNLIQRGNPVHELRDGDPLSDLNKNFLLTQFKNLRYSFKDSVFRFFKKFDEREDQLISNRTVLDFQFKLQKTERKERGRRRKCSLIEGRSAKKEEPAQKKEEGKEENEEEKEKVEKEKEQSGGEEQVEEKKPKKKRKRNRGRKRRGNREKRKRDSYDYDGYYDGNYYDDYDYKGYGGEYGKYDYEDYYDDDYYNDGYYSRREKKKRRDDDYESSYYRREDEKAPEGKNKRRNRRRKKSEKEGQKGENNPEKQGKNNRKRYKGPKKKYVAVKKTQTEAPVESN